MFGFTDAVAFQDAHFGVGIGQIFLNIVRCSGTEARLIDCSSRSNLGCFNGHSDDAGIRCQSEGLLFRLGVCIPITGEIFTL